MRSRGLFLRVSFVFLTVLLCASFATAGILVVAPHPDDEALMFSGVIYSALSRGEPVKVVLLTNGDLNGVTIGNTRQDETVSAMVNSLGMKESNIIFLGYPDMGLTPMYSYYLSSSDAYMAANGQSATYGHRGLGNSDYHFYHYGEHAYYNKPDILMDLVSIISDFRPDHIFMTSKYDQHPDHSIAHTITVEALTEVANNNPEYKPVIHKTIIHGGNDTLWPVTRNPATDFTSPPVLGSTPLNWAHRESIKLPVIMQNDMIDTNLKFNTILKYSSQLNDYNDRQDNFLTSFIHKDEIFWAENIFSSNSPPVANAGQDQTVTEGATVFLDGSSSIDPDGSPLSYEWLQLSGTPVSLLNSTSSAPSFISPAGLAAAETLVFQLTVYDGEIYSFPATAAVTVFSSSQYVNVATLATASASSQNTATDQLASKVIDGVIDGCLSNCAAEWITVGELAGAWVKLSWPESYLADKIVLYDRPNLNEQILKATLSFSDGTSITVGPLNNSGSAEEVTFPAKKFSWVMLTVTEASGTNIGLAEFEVFGNRFPSLAVTTTSPASGSVGTSYSQSLAATGGQTPYAWSITSGYLPSGLTLNSSTGVISGTPLTTGTRSFTVKVLDPGQATASKSLSISIYAKPVVSVTSLPTGNINSAYSGTLTASGGQSPYTWSISAGALPSGLMINPSTGIISGIPTIAGTSSFTVQVKDANQTAAVKSLSITLYAPLVVSTASLANGFTASAYSQSLAASGGLTPYSWSIIAGSLPDGLALNSSTGVISGVPLTKGISSFTVQVKDAQLTAVSKPLSITINAPVAVNDSYSTSVNTALNQSAPGVLGNDTASDSATLTAQLVKAPSHGTLVLNSDGSFQYTPTANYTGDDSFTYLADDGVLSSNAATVTLSVTSLSIFTDDFTRAPGTSAPLLPWTSVLGTWTVANGVLQGSGTTLAYSQLYYAPTPLWDNYSVEGRFQFAATAFGGGLGCRVNPTTGAHYAAWIYPDNSAAGKNMLVLGKMWSWTTYGGAAMAQASLPSVGTGFHTLRMVCNGSRIQVYYDGTLKIDVTDNNFDSRAPYLSGGIGAAMFTYGAAYTMTVDNVAVNRLDSNLPPTAVNDSYGTAVNKVLNQAAPGVLANDSDPEGATMTAQLVSGTSHGTLTLNSNGSFVYTPLANYVGSDSFTYRANDGTTNSNIATVTVTVTSAGGLLFSDDFTRVSGAPAPLSPWTSVLGSWTVNNGVLQGSGSALSYSQIYYAPTPLWTDYSVEGRFQFPATGFGGGLGCRVNPATGAQYSAWIFPGDNTLKLGKLWSWSQYSGVSMAEASLPVVGTGFHTLKMVCNGNRIQVYFDGTAKIDVTDNNYDSRAPYLSGGIGAALFTNSGVYSMAVDNVVVTSLDSNPAPVAVNDSYSTSANTPLNQVAPGVLSNDSAPAGTTLTAQLVNGPSHGTLTLNSNGSFVYIPLANYVGSDSFTYLANDGTTSSNTATVTVSVTAVSEILFSDDFTRVPGEPTPLSPWVSVLGSWTVTDGVLQGSGAALSYSQVYYAPAPLWDNYSVEGRFQFAATAFGGGLGCRVNPATGAHYAAWIYPDNSAAGSNMLVLGKMWSWTTYGNALMAQVSLPSVGTGFHTLKIVCNGSRIQVYYDGMLKIDVTDTNFDSRAPYLSGGVGAAMFTLGGVYTMSVDDVVVSSLP
ncbi:MAG: Ig-like domain-containing protein [Desulfuromonadaceae bacterium]|nr:Ig-like domain-containing protein [Desulfuromonadaceae bacterium]MDD2848954.1 Ig-like domain-containing protein [Desulfuromonadaceae bacterium]MDD4130303.1 Ig-like domain-containing protein [Desulfuromonadaceae bacterium]